METDAIRILIADDHPVTRIGLRDLLKEEPSFVVVGEAADGEDAIALANRLEPDVLLLDLAMPRASGIDVLRELTVSSAPTKVLLLTAQIEEQQWFTAVQLGARGVVLKDSAADCLIGAIHAVHEGRYWAEKQSDSARSASLDHKPALADALDMCGIRSQGKTPSPSVSERHLIFGDVCVDLNRIELTRAGHTTPLTNRQFRLLNFMLNNPERVLSRQELLQGVWGYSSYLSARIIDNAILQLRQLVEQDPAKPVHLKTVQGIGYKFLP